MHKLLSLIPSSHFWTHLVSLGAILHTATLPNSQAASVAIAIVTGLTQGAHAYAKVRTQPTISALDAGIRLPSPVLTNAAGDVHLDDVPLSP